MVQCVLVCDNFGPRRRVLISFVLNAGHKKNGSALFLARMLLLFCENYQTDSDGTKHVFFSYLEYGSALVEVIEELGYLCQRWSSTNKNCNSAVAGSGTKDRNGAGCEIEVWSGAFQCNLWCISRSMGQILDSCA